MAAIAVAVSASSVAAGERAPNGLRVKNQGWTASLFVTPIERRTLVGDALSPEPAGARVNARMWRRLSKDTRVSVDVLNVFDHDPPRALSRDFFAPETEGVGLRLQLRKTFK